MALKPGPKRIADSTGKPDQRQRDNKTTPGNTPSLKPSKSSEKNTASQALEERPEQNIFSLIATL